MVRLEEYGLLSARGSMSPTASAGAGSGGSILIKAYSVSHRGGVLDVRGGDASGFNGAGGGGRIAILVSSCS